MPSGNIFWWCISKYWYSLLQSGPPAAATSYTEHSCLVHSSTPGYCSTGTPGVNNCCWSCCTDSEILNQMPQSKCCQQTCSWKKLNLYAMQQGVLNLVCLFYTDGLFLGCVMGYHFQDGNVILEFLDGNPAAPPPPPQKNIRPSKKKFLKLNSLPFPFSKHFLKWSIHNKGSLSPYFFEWIFSCLFKVGLFLHIFILVCFSVVFTKFFSVAFKCL